MVGVKYQIKLLENARGIMEPIEQANYDADSIEEGEPFTKDTLKIYKSYQALKSNFFTLSLWLLGIFIIINGGIWILVHSLFERKKIKEIFHAYLKFFISTIVSIIPFLIVAYIFLKKMMQFNISMVTISKLIQGSFYFLIAFYFLLLVAFAFINIKSWKLFVKKWFKVAIKNIYWSLLVLLINLILILVSLYLVYINMNEQSFFLMTFFSVILIIVLVLTKIFWVACLKEIK